ncbi:MAG TPA: peptidase S74, partial [Terriglobia bacterium]|nr:peptidase S74 [Terriglobia bacterium]
MGPALVSPAALDSPATGSTVAGGPQAVVPRLMKFSGVLHDAVNKPLTGTVDVTFSLYNTESGGSPLWFETQSVQADELGRYTALLGAMHSDGLPIDLFTSGEVRWLGIQVGSEAEQQPRVLLVSVPYALKAGDAETLGGKPASAYML